MGKRKKKQRAGTKGHEYHPQNQPNQFYKKRKREHIATKRKDRINGDQGEACLNRLEGQESHCGRGWRNKKTGKRRHQYQQTQVDQTRQKCVSTKLPSSISNKRKRGDGFQGGKAGDSKRRRFSQPRSTSTRRDYIRYRQQAQQQQRNGKVPVQNYSAAKSDTRKSPYFLVPYEDAL